MFRTYMYANLCISRWNRQINNNLTRGSNLFATRNISTDQFQFILAL